MRLRILSRVDLPAPLRPMTPTTSPGWMATDTSLRAQSEPDRSPPATALGRRRPRRPLRSARHGAPATRVMVSRSVSYSPLGRVPIVYFLDRLVTVTAGVIA